MPILGTVASAYNLPLSVVTGGTLTSDSTYYYRTFNSSGTLGISGAPLTFDVGIWGGGGGGSITNGERGNGGNGGSGFVDIRYLKSAVA